MQFDFRITPPPDAKIEPQDKVSLPFDSFTISIQLIKLPSVLLVQLSNNPSQFNHQSSYGPASSRPNRFSNISFKAYGFGLLFWMDNTGYNNYFQILNYSKI